MTSYHYWLSQLNRIYNPEESKSVIGKYLFNKTGKGSAFWMGNSEQDWATLEHDLALLANGKPVQQIIGWEDFGALQILVNEDVLIPRPETYGLVEWILEDHTELNSLLDLCTGSGCIALALKYKRPLCAVSGCDVSFNALQVANQNKHNLQLALDFFLLDVLNDPIPTGYNIWVSNPPYIAINEAAEMHDNVLNYEPHIALFSEDPNAFYKKIIHSFLIDATASFLYFELNPKTCNELKKLCSEMNLEQETRIDFRGKERMMKISRSS
jgi:release factor glutamine methyltransferase